MLREDFSERVPILLVPKRYQSGENQASPPELETEILKCVGVRGLCAVRHILYTTYCFTHSIYCQDFF
jgi:hypothetical protein